MPRFLKQFIYGVFYVTILGLVSWFIYQIYFPAPIPPAPCVTCNLKIESAEVIVLPLSEQTSSFLVKVKNPSSDYGLKKFNYQFKVFSKLGPAVKSVLGVSSLYPDEEKYIAVSNVNIAFADIITVKFEPLDTPWQAKISFGPRSDVNITNTHIENLDNFLSLTGQLANQSNQVFDNVSIIAILKGDSDKIIAVSTLNLENIKPQSKQEFRIFMPKVSYKEYIIYTDVLTAP